MKAIVASKHHAPDGLILQELEKPAPKNHEVLIRIHAATVTAGDVVLHNLPGFLYWSPVKNILGIPPKKLIPGHEFAGEIAAVGKNVTRFKTGERVFGTTTGLRTGANAEYVCVPESWATGLLVKKPSSITYKEAAAVPVGGMTALYLLRQAKLQSGQSVLIYGASGSVGSYAVQLASYFGAEVTGVGSTGNVDLVKSLGADKVIDYTKEDFAQNGKTYDVIFDAVGKISKAHSKRVLKEGGRYVSIRSATHETTASLEFIGGLLEAGEIKAVIDRCYPLEQTAEAYRYVKTGRKKGNVIITVAHSAHGQPKV